MAGVTAKDIAKRLNITPAAVSMALNGKPGVSERTRTMVLEEAAKLGYSTPRAAREAQKGVPNITYVIYVGAGVAAESTFSSGVLKGVEAMAKKLGYRVVVDYLYEDRPLWEQLPAIVSDTCGIVLLGTDIRKAQRDALNRQMLGQLELPMVVVDNFLFASTVDCVGNDNMFGSKAAVSYLIRAGHRKIGYLRARQRIANFDDRQVGINLAMEEHRTLGLAPLQVVDVDIAQEKAYGDIDGWLSRGNTPASAYFAENDVLAAAAIRAFKHHGYRVPEDVSVMGFDDIALCEMTDPPITTMHSFKERLGELSVQFLSQRIQRGEAGWTGSSIAAMKVAVAMTVKERASVMHFTHGRERM